MYLYTNKVTVRSNNGVKLEDLSFRECISYERLQLCTGRNSVKQWLGKLYKILPFLFTKCRSQNVFYWFNYDVYQCVNFYLLWDKYIMSTSLSREGKNHPLTILTYKKWFQSTSLIWDFPFMLSRSKDLLIETVLSWVSDACQKGEQHNSEIGQRGIFILPPSE